ncbi:MAG: NB-ARC domain-containing protein, partial [Anaerolineales bacterium]
MSDSGDVISTGNISGIGHAIGRGAQSHVTVNLPPEPLPASPLHQLPPPPPNFTGRDDELKTLRADLQSGVTISGLRGMGGVGKTALALVLANELKAQYPNAQFYLNLLGASDKPLAPADALAHIIRSYQPLAKLPEGEAGLQALYRNALTGQRALLLMDNARDAAQVKPLLPPTGCFLLVTSRKQIELGGMRSLPLGVLSKEKAQELLLKLEPRLRGEGLGVTAHIAELCGYLPLALALAAGAFKRADGPTPEEYAARLADRRKRLRALDESAELTGENALTATLQESYDRLTAEQQQRWRALSVFPADFDRAGAAAVWAIDDDDAREMLSTLTSYSLLEYANGRYGLHDLARDFAAGQLPDAARAEAQARHAEHYKNMLSAANKLYLQGNENITHGLALFDAERANI